MIPSRDAEKRILASLRARGIAHPILAGVDEVGRGAIAGPVSVGIALIDGTTSDDFPEGLRDSKQLTPRRRSELAPKCHTWALSLAVGHAPARAVDEAGIVGALRIAAAAALEELEERGYRPDAVLLDGSHNWWSETGSLFAPDLPDVPVQMYTKGDAACAVVAAASVAAKVERDELMERLDARYPGYEWAANKGYGTGGHARALARLGASEEHRRSWNLPGLAQE